MNLMKKYILLCFSGFTLFIIFLSYNNIEINLKLIAALTLIWSFINLVQNIKNPVLFITYGFLFYFIYSIIFFHYFNPDYSTIYANFIQDEILYKKAVSILLIFVFSLFSFNNIFFNNKGSFLVVEFKNNIFISLGCILFILYNIFFQYNLNLGMSSRGELTPLYEYTIIFFIFGIIYSNKNRYMLSTYYFLALIIFLQNFLTGNRISGLGPILVIYILFIFPNIKLRSNLILLFGVLLLGTIVGVRRLSGQNHDISYIIDNFFKTGLSLDTAYSAFYTSLTFLKFESFNTWGNRINNFFSTLIYYFFGIGDKTNIRLPNITINYYSHYFGGVLPFYFHFWLGTIGTIFSGFLVSIYSNLKMDKHSNNYLYVVFLYFGVTTPRWFLYEPSNLIRGTLILSIVYFLFVLIDSITKKERRTIK